MIHRSQPLQVENSINSAIYLVNPEKNIKLSVSAYPACEHLIMGTLMFIGEEWKAEQ